MTHTTLRSEEMFDFCTQMSMILAGGLSVEEGLEIIDVYKRQALQLT